MEAEEQGDRDTRESNPGHSGIPQFDNRLIAGTLGAGLYFAWFYLIYFSNVLRPVTMSGLHTEFLFRSAALFAFAASLFLALMFNGPILRYRMRLLFSVLGPLLPIPLFVLSIAFPNADYTQTSVVLFTVSWILAGLACFNFALNTSVFFSSLDASAVPFVIAVSVLIGAGIYWVINLALFPLNIVATAILPFLITLGNYFTDAPSIRKKVDFHVEHKMDGVIDYLRLGNTLMPLQVIFGIVFGFAIATGIFIGVSQSATWRLASMTTWFNVLLVFMWLSGPILLIYYLKARRSLDFDKMSWILLSASMIALLVMLLSNRYISYACCCVLVLCFSLFDYLHIQSTALFAQELTGDGLVIFCTNRFFVYIGVFIGYFTAQEILHLTDYTSPAFAVCLIVIVSAFIILITRTYLRSNQPSTAANMPYKGNAGKWKVACKAICEESELSARQVEVFMLLAKGRNSIYIQESLVISSHTVKAHIYRIYQKLGIHSQQELLNMVEEKVRNQ